VPEMTCFGSFELDLEIETLPRRGIGANTDCVRSQRQSFEALAVLLETPGRYSKDQPVCDMPTVPRSARESWIVQDLTEKERPRA
jgi:hypothetical protein